MNTNCMFCGKAFPKGYGLSTHERECFKTLSDYEKGYYDGVWTFAVWRDGTEMVGVTQMPFRKYIAEWLEERRRNKR